MTDNIIKMSVSTIWKQFSKNTIKFSSPQSTLYNAINKKTGKYVAIKEINKYEFKDIQKYEKIVNKIKSENYISIKEIIEEREFYYIVMELCLCNIEEYLKIKGEPFSINEIFEMLTQINNTFKIMQKEKMIHKNLKLSNLLLKMENLNKMKIVISDFNPSDNLENLQLLMTKTKKKNNYFTTAPEILKGEEISSKVDIWSLGIIIYYLIFNEYPYTGETEFKFIKDIHSNKPLKIINDNELNDLVKKMLCANVNERLSWDDYFNHPFFKKQFNQDNQINFPQFNFLCNIHSQIIESYCNTCKLNICKSCFDKHISHKIISFSKIGLSDIEKKNIDNIINDIENNYNKILKIKNDILNLLKNIKSINSNSLIYEEDTENNYKQYYINFLNSLKDRITIPNNITILKLSLNDFEVIENSKITEDDIKNLFIKYPPLNDDIYVELKKPIQYENYSQYYGELSEKNERHGRGIQIWIDGSRYEGYWKNDKANIKGKLIHSDGAIYEGEFKDDKANGYGKYIHNVGSKFEGNWENDKQSGYGKESWPDGSNYEGYYKDGKKCGKGKFKWGDGSTYEGEFIDNNINGKGIYKWSDQRQYIGYWKDGKLNGSGTFIWPDGRTYQGEYLNDKKDGLGIFKWPDGRIFKGYWKDGKQNGEGEFYNKEDGVWRKGIWENGKRIQWL